MGERVGPLGGHAAWPPPGRDQLLAGALRRPDGATAVSEVERAAQGWLTRLDARGADLAVLGVGAAISLAVLVRRVRRPETTGEQEAHEQEVGERVNHNDPPSEVE